MFAGGCFWGVEAVFRHVKGVSRAVSGYAGGTTKNPTYEQVSSGDTGHAESVEVTYDPAQVTYGQLLKVFFQVAHDPTQLNRQGPDRGTQYRSAIFYVNDEQKRVAQAYVAQLGEAKAFNGTIVTEIAPLDDVLSGRGLSPELPRAAPQPALHRLQRPAEARRAARGAPVALRDTLSGRRSRRPRAARRW